MKAILRQSAFLVLFSFFLVGLFCLVSGLLSGLVPERKYVDTCFHYFSTKTPHNAFIQDIWNLSNSDRPKMIFLGSSNTMFGFSRKSVQPIFPEYEVADCALPAGGVESVLQIVELIQDILPRDVLDKSVFVVGISYHLIFSHDEGIAEPLLKSGLYKLKDHRILPIMSPDKIHIIIRILRPHFFIQRKWTRVKRYFPRLLNKIHQRVADGKDEGKRIDDFSVNRRLSEKRKKQLVRFHTSTFRPGDKEGFLKLLDVCEAVEKRGGKLVLLDMPLPKWYQERASLHHKYQDTKGKYLESALDFQCVRYINLLKVPEFAEESMFRDASHVIYPNMLAQFVRDGWNVEPPVEKRDRREPSSF